MKVVGVGDRHYSLAVCIANRPALMEYETLDDIAPLGEGEVARIILETGNHWRKIFSLYAKLLVQLGASHKAPSVTWQSYRDQFLLGSDGRHALLFSDPRTLYSADKIFIIAGKTYAETLGVLETATQIDRHFYIDRSRNMIVSPYFDYRQLSNEKLDMLVSIIKDNFKQVMV